MTVCSTPRYHSTGQRCAGGTQERLIAVSLSGFRLLAPAGSPRILQPASRATSAVGCRGEGRLSRASTSTTSRRNLCRRCLPTGDFGWSARRPTRRQVSGVCAWADWEPSRFRFEQTRCATSWSCAVEHPAGGDLDLVIKGCARQIPSMATPFPIPAVGVVPIGTVWIDFVTADHRVGAYYRGDP